jgi:WD40 repeat protein
VPVSDDGHILAVGSDDDTVRLIGITDPRHPVSLATLTGPAPGVMYQSAFSPDGHLLAAAGSDHSVCLWDIASRARPRLLAALGGFANAAYSAAFSPGGTILAAGSADDTVRLWDITRPGHPQSLGRPLTGPAGYVYSVAFDPARGISRANAGARERAETGEG